MGLLGTSWGDPKTLATLQMAAGLLGGGNFGQAAARGLSAYSDTMSEANKAAMLKEERDYIKQQREMKAEQEKLKAERDLQRIEVEAKQKVASARAEAEALALQRQQITPDLLALRRIENEREAIRKWDGKLPNVTSGAVPFINVSDKN